jgi:hypothetical protein
MADETMAVKLTLRKHVAERLRKMCHTRGLTASELVDEWILRADEKGRHRSAEERRTDDFMGMVQDAIKQARTPK